MIPPIKTWIITATIGYILGFSITGAITAFETYQIHHEPDPAPPVPAALEQELRFLRSEIEQEKITLVQHQQASYEALQEAEALRARVEHLKLEQRISGRKN